MAMPFFMSLGWLVSRVGGDSAPFSNCGISLYFTQQTHFLDFRKESRVHSCLPTFIYYLRSLMTLTLYLLPNGYPSSPFVSQLQRKFGGSYGDTGHFTLVLMGTLATSHWLKHSLVGNSQKIGKSASQEGPQCVSTVMVLFLYFQLLSEFFIPL